MGGGVSTENQYLGGRFLKKRAWTICKFKGGLSGKEEGGVFYTREGGWYPNKHYEFKKEYFIKRTIYKLHALHLINFQKKINESRFEALKVVQKRSNFLLRWKATTIKMIPIN